jgi:hypothetical protein
MHGERISRLAQELLDVTGPDLPEIKQGMTAHMPVCQPLAVSPLGSSGRVLQRPFLAFRWTDHRIGAIGLVSPVRPGSSRDGADACGKLAVSGRSTCLRDWATSGGLAIVGGFFRLLDRVAPSLEI